MKHNALSAKMYHNYIFVAGLKNERLSEQSAKQFPPVCVKSGKIYSDSKNEFYYENRFFLREMYIYKNEAMLTGFLYIYISNAVE